MDHQDRQDGCWIETGEAEEVGSLKATGPLNKVGSSLPLSDL